MINEKNLKGTTINTVEYTGIVTLSQYIKGKKVVISKIHNEGGKALFDFLTDCLLGDFDLAKVDRPTKIMLLDTAGGVITKANNTGFVSLLSNPVKVYDANMGIIRYSFHITQDLFAGTSFDAIGLYPNSATELDLDRYAAKCNIEDSDLEGLSVSSVLVLDWELRLANLVTQ